MHSHIHVSRYGNVQTTHSHAHKAAVTLVYFDIRAKKKDKLCKEQHTSANQFLCPTLSHVTENKDISSLTETVFEGAHRVYGGATALKSFSVCQVKSQPGRVAKEKRKRKWKTAGGGVGGDTVNMCHATFCRLSAPPKEIFIFFDEYFMRNPPLRDTGTSSLENARLRKCNLRERFPVQRAEHLVAAGHAKVIIVLANVSKEVSEKRLNKETTIPCRYLRELVYFTPRAQEYTTTVYTNMAKKQVWHHIVQGPPVYSRLEEHSLQEAAITCYATPRFQLKHSACSNYTYRYYCKLSKTMCSPSLHSQQFYISPPGFSHFLKHVRADTSRWSKKPASEISSHRCSRLYRFFKGTSNSNSARAHTHTHTIYIFMTQHSLDVSTVTTFVQNYEIHDDVLFFLYITLRISMCQLCKRKRFGLRAKADISSARHEDGATVECKSFREMRLFPRKPAGGRQRPLRCLRARIPVRLCVRRVVYYTTEAPMAKYSKFTLAIVMHFFRILDARSIHVTWLPGAPMAIAMSQYSLHVSSMASLTLQSTTLSLAVCLTLRHINCSIATSPHPYLIGLPHGEISGLIGYSMLPVATRSLANMLLASYAILMASAVRVGVRYKPRVGVLNASEGEARRVWCSAGMQGRRKQEYPEKNPPACENIRIVSHIQNSPLSQPPTPYHAGSDMQMALGVAGGGGGGSGSDERKADVVPTMGRHATTQLAYVERFGRLLTARSSQPMSVKLAEYGATPECKGEGKGRSLRKPPYQRHRPARFPTCQPGVLLPVRTLSNWESCRTMPLVGGSSQGTPVFIALSFRRRSILTSIILIGSQDLGVKSRSNLFTHQVSPCTIGTLPIVIFKTLRARDLPQSDLWAQRAIRQSDFSPPVWWCSQDDPTRYDYRFGTTLQPIQPRPRPLKPHQRAELTLTDRERESPSLVEAIPPRFLVKQPYCVQFYSQSRPGIEIYPFLSSSIYSKYRRTAGYAHILQPPKAWLLFLPQRRQVDDLFTHPIVQPASRTLHCLILAVADFPPAGHFSRCSSSITLSHQLLGSETCLTFISFALATWKVQRTPSRAERTSAVHTRRTQQVPVTRVEPACSAATHEREARLPLHTYCDVNCTTTLYQALNDEQSSDTRLACEAVRSEVCSEQHWNERAGGNEKSPRKPAADTIPTCDNPGAAPSGIETGSPRTTAQQMYRCVTAKCGENFRSTREQDVVRLDLDVGISPQRVNIEVLRADEGDTRWVWNSVGMQVRGIREIPAKTHRPAAMSSTISTYDNPGAAPSGIEPGTPCGDLATPPPPLNNGKPASWHAFKVPSLQKEEKGIMGFYGSAGFPLRLNFPPAERRRGDVKKNEASIRRCEKLWRALCATGNAKVILQKPGAKSAAPRRNRRPTSPSPLPGTMRSRPPDSPFWESRECQQWRDLLESQTSSRLLEFPIRLATTQECSGETCWRLSPPQRITRVGEDSRSRPKTLYIYILPQPSGRQSLMETAWPSVRERRKCGRRLEIAGRRRWSDFSHPTKANQVRFPSGSLPDFRTCWSAGFLGELPFCELTQSTPNTTKRPLSDSLHVKSRMDPHGNSASKVKKRGSDTGDTNTQA
ncbi:hypothetical protein PR048_024221 [Dryococelus australis]|uniref:Uncharacterized protein n=1 Tax=Dryococelus australis TaxID=614101 RepID=A0ABQ9GMY5_9NEOP|nr:hypothetical protein PR048_024221 [Dryococelus australis]